jgi:hypothetical protein
MTLNELKDPATHVAAEQKRQRGYDFEKYLYDAFEAEDLQTKRPFKKPGEQIDGGIYLDGRWYLVEAKWHAKPLPVSEVYGFRGKVDGKFSGTCGFFISWSGYSEECSDALTLGKELNVILCDAADVEQAEQVGWKVVLRNKLMFASLYGLIYAPPRTQDSISEQEASHHNIEIYVEGATDADIIGAFMRELDVENWIVVTAGGKLNAIQLASTLPKLPDCKRILILDTDGNLDQDDELKDLPKVDKVISIDPQIENLFFPTSDEPKYEFRKNGLKKSKSTLELYVREAIQKDPLGFVKRLRAILPLKKS